jgi:2-polyprenyl-3-methyl-5-hydroxy-6-metoxy-1,4-benzoquinol methylase
VTVVAACDCCGADDWHPLFEEHGFTLGWCGRCHLHYVDRVPPIEARMTEMEEGHFADDAAIVDADRHRKGEQVREAHFAGYVELVRRTVTAGRWLDIGCGAGALLHLAQQAGFEVEGIELTPDRRAAAAAATGATIHGTPVEALGLPGASFDVISLINVFSHLVSPTATLVELKRLLRPGGVVLIATGEVLPGAKRSHMGNWCLGDHLHWLGDNTMDVYVDKLDLVVTHHERVPILDLLYTREWASMRGASTRTNALKAVLRTVPGALPALNTVVRRRQRDNAVCSSVFTLQAARS